MDLNHKLAMSGFYFIHGHLIVLEYERHLFMCVFEISIRTRLNERFDNLHLILYHCLL